ncbi:MAG: molybdopterin-binding protein [Campylobacterota bacterium]|nr:molybdopterin-binding protein [Campylobacterota bacterium]
MNFYSVIIGTELLNGRRKDAHFSFLNQELLKRGWEQKANFVIKDDPLFIESVFNLVKNDPKGVMFCFGGIGATPDDYTRQVAANVFTGGKMQQHEEAFNRIINQFGQEAYPHRIHMANLPLNAGLLNNVVNNVPGFYLEDRYFFTPGFPKMSQAMIVEALDTFFAQNKPIHRLSLKASCSENELIPIMKQIPSHIDFSSLPQMQGDKRYVVISIASYDQIETQNFFQYFIHYLQKENFHYVLSDN